MSSPARSVFVPPAPCRHAGAARFQARKRSGIGDGLTPAVGLAAQGTWRLRGPLTLGRCFTMLPGERLFKIPFT